MADWGFTQVLGYAAAGMVLATFSARSVTTLRTLAIASNVLFISYAACAHLPPVLVLHVLLLPLNLLRLRESLAGKRPREGQVVSPRGSGRRRPG